MKKVITLADHFAVGGGAGEIARIQADDLAKSHEVKVLAAHAPEGQSANYEVMRFDLDYDPKLRTYLGLYHPKAVKILRAALANYQPDICYVHNLNTNWSYHCLKVLRDVGIKTVLFFHDVTAVTPYVKLCGMKHERDYRYSWWRELRGAKFSFNPFRRRLVRKYLSLASERVAVSQALADFLAVNGIKIDRVEHNKLPAIPKVSEVYNNSIFFGGRLSTSKGALMAVRFLAVLKEKYKLGAKLFVAGTEGVITEKMKVLAATLGVGQQIRFLGWLDQAQYQAAMRNCGVVIVPSICFDSFPTMILEAMRAGRGVVATIYGGSREMVEEGKTGFIRNPKNIREFTEAIAQVLADPKQYGQAGYNKFMEEFRLS